MCVADTGGWKWELTQSWACPELSERQVKGNTRKAKYAVQTLFFFVFQRRLLRAANATRAGCQKSVKWRFGVIIRGVISSAVLLKQECNLTLKIHHLCGTVLWHLTEWHLWACSKAHRLWRFSEILSDSFPSLPFALEKSTWLLVTSEYIYLKEKSEALNDRGVIHPTEEQTGLRHAYLSHMENLCTYITSVPLSVRGAKAKASLLDGMRFIRFILKCIYSQIMFLLCIGDNSVQI